MMSPSPIMHAPSSPDSPIFSPPSSVDRNLTTRQLQFLPAVIPHLGDQDTIIFSKVANTEATMDDEPVVRFKDVHALKIGQEDGQDGQVYPRSSMVENLLADIYERRQDCLGFSSLPLGESSANEATSLQVSELRVLRVARNSARLTSLHLNDGLSQNQSSNDNQTSHFLPTSRAKTSHLTRLKPPSSPSIQNIGKLQLHRSKLPAGSNDHFSVKDTSGKARQKEAGQEGSCKGPTSVYLVKGKPEKKPSESLFIDVPHVLSKAEALKCSPCFHKSVLTTQPGVCDNLKLDTSHLQNRFIAYGKCCIFHICYFA
ncbi:unnamed protein product [Protopolystoma xenopodis]|uniref:Uncharacterized protein n=1 Tax=Protopolystoma xenopodis TaxID=117903 RepID=A0A448WJI9_9PLAT|nr:unnamed protein product [Protopolystoma xenopodis]